MREYWMLERLKRFEGDSRPAQIHVGADDSAVVLSRAELLSEVLSAANGFTSAGLRAGDRVAMPASSPRLFTPAFLGANWIGAVPVPLPPPPSLGRQDGWRANVRDMLAVAQPTMICAPSAELNTFQSFGLPVVSCEALSLCAPDKTQPVPYDPDRLLYLQFSSGSTAAPRAVAARTEAVITNCVHSMIHGLEVDPAQDLAASWVPLHHDLGMICFFLAPLTVDVPSAFLSTSAFVRDPNSWLRSVSRLGATLTAAPNFALGLAMRRATPQLLAELDLARLRVIVLGGERNNPEVMRRFMRLFEPCGLRAESLMPSYGLAESTMAVCGARHDRAPRIDRVSASTLEREGRAVSVPDGDVEVVECGPPLPDHEIAIMDDQGMPCPERVVGEIWVRGASVAKEYVGAQGLAFRADGWLRTGDTGYLADGALYPLGRIKDVMIVNGCNIDPQRVEWPVEAIDGVRPGGVVAFTRPGIDTEEIVVVAECRQNPYGDQISRQVSRVVSEHVMVSVSDVVLVKPGAIAKTTSGKPRRGEMRRRYLAGDL